MTRSLFVADVGNSTVDVAEFQLADSNTESASQSFPSTIRTQKLRVDRLFELDNWCDLAQTEWLIGSVNQAVAVQLEEQLLSYDVGRVQNVIHSDLSLKTALPTPSATGIDRLAAAMAANHLRVAERPAIIVDAGSAITVDVVSKDGVFLGGMITPGVRLSAASLAANTDLLPKISVDSCSFNTPPLVGDDTTSAIQAGVFWMTVAGINGIVSRLKQELAGPSDVFCTGGSMPSLIQCLAHHPMTHKPDLVLSGLAMARRR